MGTGRARVVFAVTLLLGALAIVFAALDSAIGVTVSGVLLASLVAVLALRTLAWVKVVHDGNATTRAALDDLRRVMARRSERARVDTRGALRGVQAAVERGTSDLQSTIAEEQTKLDDLVAESRGARSEVEALQRKIDRQRRGVQRLGEKQEEYGSGVNTLKVLRAQLVTRLDTYEDVLQRRLSEAVSEVRSLAESADRADEGALAMSSQALDSALGRLVSLEQGFSDHRTGVDAIARDVARTAAQLTDVRAEVRLVGTVGAAPVDPGSNQATSGGVNREVQRAIARLRHEPVSEVEALIQLYARYPAEFATPPSGGWAMSPLGLLRLESLVAELGPVTVVECGSGASTIWLGRFLRSVGGGRVVSLDHDQRFGERTRVAVRRHGLDDLVEVRHAPLTEVDAGVDRYRWYDPRALDDVDDLGLVVVDGPPEGTGPVARYPAGPFLLTRLLRGGAVLLDDASRPGEIECVKRWQEELPELESDLAYGRDHVVLRRGGPVSSEART